MPKVPAENAQAFWALKPEAFGHFHYLSKILKKLAHLMNFPVLFKVSTASVVKS